MIRIQLVFDHHKRTAKGDEGPVEVRVTVNRKPYYINTGVRVRQDRLIGNTVRDVEVKGQDGLLRLTDDADLLNERLATIVRLVEENVNTCLKERRDIDVAEIRRRVWDLQATVDDDDEPTLIKWIREQTAIINVAKSTRIRYLTLCNRLAEYGKITRWEHLTVENIYAWDAWLHELPVQLTVNQLQAGVEQAKVGDAAVASYHKGLRAMLHRALKVGKITANPYDRLRGEFKSGRRETVDYLTEEQMQKLLAITPVPGSQFAMARDLFVFQIFTGLAYIDTQRFDIGLYRRDVERDAVTGEDSERWVYIGSRTKTGVPYVSQLLPPAVDVLKRNGWRVPKMNNQRYNQMLKAIGMVIGIDRLHSHMGRHTFATWMLSQGARIENVSRMLGHTDIKMTQRYAKVLAKDVLDDFDRVAEKLKKTANGGGENQK